MSENVKYGILKDYDGNKFIPIGHSELVYDEDGKSVEERLNAIESSNVQKVAEGTEDGTIAVTTNGVTENVPVHGLGFQDDGSYHFIDNEDNVIAEVDTGGVHSIDFIIDNKDISLTGVKAQADALRTDLNNLSADAIKEVVAGSGLTGGGSNGSVTLNIGAGSGITVAADTISHADTSNLTGAQSASSGKAITSITVDGFGHVTATGTSDVVNKIKAGTGISVDKTTGEATITNAGVRSIGTGTKKGTISVNTNGTTANVAVNGLGFEDDGSYHFIDEDNKTVVKIDKSGITTSGDVATTKTSLNTLKTDFTNFANNVITGVTAGDGLSGGGSAGDVSLKVNVNKGLTISNDKIGHSNAITAGTAQGSATKTLGYGDTFTIPTVTYDAQGHITSKGTTTMTMPKMPTASDLSLTNAMVFLGTTTTPLIDGISTNPISIGGKNITAVNGNVVLYDGKEYVWSSNLTSWEELGDEGSHALKSITVTAGDGLTGGGDLSKNMTISHAKEYGVTDTTAQYTSANTTTSINGSGASGTVKIPQIKVDEFGHVVSATDENVAITMPTVNNKTITITAGNGLTTGGSFTTNASSNKEITLNVGAGEGITVEANTVTNSGVRSIASGTKKGTISVNTNGAAADVAVTGLGFKDDGSYHFIDENNNTVVKIDKSGITTGGDVATKTASLNGLKSSFDTFVTGAITGVTAGTGLSGGGSAGDVNINLDVASSSTIGGIKVSSKNTTAVTVNSESTTSGRYYPVELNSDNKAIVNIPWTDTKVTSEKNNTAKAYITGTVAGGNGTLVYDDKVYLDTTAGQLSVGSLNLTNQDSFIFIDKNNNVGATINKNGIVTSGDVSAGTVSLKSLKTSVDALASTTNTKTKTGLVPAPGASAANKVWKTDGSGNPGWKDDTNTTYTLSGKLNGNTFINTLTPSSGSKTTATVPAMSKATASAAGKAGLVPAPGAGKQASFLRGDGSWSIPVTISSGDNNGQIRVTLSGGTAYDVDVPGLGTAAYVNTDMFLPAITTYAGSRTIAGPANSALKLENAKTFTIGNTSKDFNGENGVSWSHSEIGYANSSSGLLSAGAQTIAGAKTFTSTITAKTLKISSKTEESHIAFSRSGYNYLHAPADGSIALCAANAVAMDSSALVVNKTNVFPGKDNTFALGTSSYRWKDVYGITGNFNTATITGAILHLQNQNYTRPSDGVVVIPTETKYHWIDFVDSAGTNAANRLGMICQSISSTNGTNRVGMYTYDLTDSTGNTMACLYTEYDQNGVAKAGSSAPFYGAVWNDYAEFRKYKDNEEIPYGHIVIENGDDSLSLSTARLQKGGNVCSDTFGFAIGETEETKMPIAVAGRALVYTYEDRNSYEPGDAVCTGPNGTISKMTREEIKEYPDCIIGYVSAIPDYEIWGEHNTKVNNRIWIKVK